MNACRVGGDIGLLGVPHGDLPVDQLFWQNKGLKGGPAHVRAYLPHLLDLVLSRQINPGRVFDLELPLADMAFPNHMPFVLVAWRDGVGPSHD